MIDLPTTPGKIDYEWGVFRIPIFPPSMNIKELTYIEEGDNCKEVTEKYMFKIMCIINKICLKSFWI